MSGKLPSPDAAGDGVALFVAQDGAGFMRGFALCLAMGALATTLVSLSEYGSAILQPQLLGGPSVGAICALAYVQMRRGRMKAGLQLLLWGTALVANLFAYLSGGAHTPALILLPTIVLVAGWILGRRATWTMAALSVLNLGALVALQQAALLPLPTPRPAIIPGLILFALCAIGTLLGLNASKAVAAQVRRVAELSEAIRRRIGELQESETRVQTLFRASPLPSISGDDEGLVVDVNDAWCASFGLSRVDVVGRASRDLGIWIDAEARKEVGLRLRAEGRVDGVAADLRVADGSVRQFLVYVVGLGKDARGKRGYLASFHDQTDRLAAEAAQRTRSSELEAIVAERTEQLSNQLAALEATRVELLHAEKLAALGPLVAGISHELNTPIGNTLVVASALHTHTVEFADQVGASGIKRSQLNTYLSTARDASILTLRAAERAANLIDGFQALAATEDPDLRRRFDLRELAAQALARAALQWPDPHWTTRLDIAPGIVCDSYPGALGRILDHLLQNAALHAFADRRQGRLAILAAVGDGQVHLSVSDDGNGMDGHTLHRAFDPFFTTRMGQGSSGLGLFVCHQLAESMLGGSLAASSTLGSGSQLLLSFPQTCPRALG